MNEQRRKIYGFIVRYKEQHDGNSPTYREIMTGCQLKSVSTVGYYLADLEDRGLIVRSVRRGGARVIEVVGGQWIAPEFGE